MSAALGLSDRQTDALLSKTPPQSSPHLKSRPVTTLKVDQFRALSEWHHFAILDLSTCKDFRSEPLWIAKRLRIASSQVRDAVARLLRLGLLRASGSTWVKANVALEVPTRKAEPEIRAFHKQMITKSLEALESPSIDAYRSRDIRAVTMAIDPKKLSEAKAMVARFHQELSDFLTSGDCTEVYQFNSQLFALTYPVSTVPTEESP